MWPECPWKLTIVTNKVKIDTRERVVYTHAGRIYGTYMSTFMENYLHDEDFIIVMLEDYIIHKVNRALIAHAYDIMQKDPNIGEVRLYPKPGPSLPFNDDPDIGEINRSDLYPASLQVTMWRTDVYRSILSPGESPWEIEEAGSWRLRHAPENMRYLCVREPAIDYFNYASKGVLSPVITEWIKEHR
jgi:hypothetical protein